MKKIVMSVIITGVIVFGCVGCGSRAMAAGSIVQSSVDNQGVLL